MHVVCLWFNGLRKGAFLDFEFDVKKESRRKRLSITVLPDNTVKVLSPLNFSTHQINQFVLEKRQWIQRVIAKNTLFFYPKFQGKNKDRLPFLGKDYFFQFQLSNVTSISVQNDQIIMQSRSKLSLHEMSRQLQSWYLGCAKDILFDRAIMFAEEMNCSFNQLRVKTLRSRWGSCSSLKNINFNWVLVMCPMSVLDYVVIHELAHLKHMNHSAAFWKHVERFCPNYQEQKNWLKDRASLLSIL